ncbi:MAG TPA: hypothetical protein VGI03_01055 [Verrucomicrobiae bacterium]|jgi:hypothetical protein
MKEIITDSIRYWETRRLVYNGALALVVVSSFVWHLPVSAAGLQWPLILGLFVAAVVANVLYCSAYLADFLFQASGHQQLWKRWRWVLLIIGTAFAAGLYLLASGI